MLSFREGVGGGSGRDAPQLVLVEVVSGRQRKPDDHDDAEDEGVEADRVRVLLDLGPLAELLRGVDAARHHIGSQAYEEQPFPPVHKILLSIVCSKSTCLHALSKNIIS